MACCADGAAVLGCRNGGCNRRKLVPQTEVRTPVSFEAVAQRYGAVLQIFERPESHIDLH